MNVRVLTLAVSFAVTSTACVNVRYYRDSLDVRAGPPDRYTFEVSRSTAAHGSYAKVTKDAKGRVTRVAEQRDGRVTHEHIYDYTGDAALPDTERNYTQGALTRVMKITRDPAGQIQRLESYTAQGELTGYVEAVWDSTSERRTNYTPAGVPRWTWTTHYSPEGIKVKSVYRVEGNNTYSEHTWDPGTGVEKSSKVFDIDGRLQSSHVNTFDDSNDLVRSEIFDPEGHRYGVWTYENGLLVRKAYDFRSGGHQETRLKYNAGGRAEGAEFYRDDKLICIFVYEYLQDDTIKRTIAHGPDGSVWAEYPNRYTDSVNKDGYPPNSAVGVIYHRDAWF